MTTAAADPRPVAALRGLSHRYGKVSALDDVTLDLPAGRMLGLVGPDGVGKSTLLGLLAGARRIQCGTVEVLGGPMERRAHRAAVLPRIAYMPQGLGRNLYAELSVAENLDFFARLFGHGAEERRQRMDFLLEATGLAPFPDRPAGKLSGGMKQKLGLCCALIHDPDLLILDEPTTGVDPLSRRQFWDLIDGMRDRRPGMSVLVSTAYMDEAARFDWLAAMDGGRILAAGSPADLLAQTGAADLEAAYVALLPEGRDRGGGAQTVPAPQTPDGPPAIVARGLTRRFGDFTAVRDVSFEIRKGEIFGFLGSNGCGKSTVMKMLTGLLPPSEGEALIFGQKVRPGDMAARGRVGFMSQGFSLYGELTVAENLRLHARLYHLPAETGRARIAALLEDFGLAPHAAALARGLPLGVRQRLSLACAIVHSPDMLILDEPTSGVDPVARDAFWQLLVRLSRRDGVTIFVSTHFMNEAMRCDRISLMHAGEVLVYGRPGDLAREDGATSLEDTFIRYIGRAMGDAARPGTGRAAQAQAPAAAPPPARRAGGPGRMLAISRREALDVARDPVRLAFAFLGSMILMLLFAYGISTDVDNLTFAVLDQDRSPESRAYLANFEGSSTFIERPELRSAADLHQRMRQGEIALAIEIPPGFGRAVTTGAPTSVAAWIDGAVTFRASIIEGYVQGAHREFLTRRATLDGQGDRLAATLVIAPRYRYNPDMRSLDSMAPAVPAILLMLFPAILMAVSIAREREIGTITNFYVTPTTRLEYLLGKQMPYVAIAFANWAILTGMAVLLFGVPLKGSGAALALGALAYGFAATGFGLVVAGFARSQVVAVFATMILAMMPTVQFSGLTQPVATLEGAARIMGQLWPTGYFMQMSLGAFAKGLGFWQMVPNIAILAAFVPAFVGLAVLLLQKQER